MSEFDDYLAEQLQDPEIKAEWDALEPEFAIKQALIDARKEQGITQQELSKRTGISQADISRFENGNSNPTYATLVRLAQGLNMRFEIKLVPV